MPESITTVHPGLSNSIMTIFAEGGLLLGGLCFFPYLIGLLLFSRKGFHHIALWTLGLLGIYIGIIFNFRFYLLLILAFGYSLIVPNKRQVFVAAEFQVFSFDLNALKQFAKQLICFSIIFVLIFVFRNPLFKSLHVFLNQHRWFLGQSVWKTLVLIFSLIFLCGILSEINKRRIPFGQTKAFFLTLFSFILYACFVSVYPVLYAYIDALLTAFHFSTEPWESIILLGCFIIVLTLFWRVILDGYRFLHKKLLSTFLVMIIGLVAFIVVYKSLSVLDYQAELISGEDRKLIEQIATISKNQLFANNSPALYRRLDSSIHFSATKNRGFASYYNTSILFDDGSDIPELFNAGYQVTRVSDKTLLYSNDDEVVNMLTQQGYQFYRYYPYSISYPLVLASWMNNLEWSEDWKLVLDGPAHSLVYGPYDTLDANTYTATFNLRLLTPDLDANASICTLQICYDSGDKTVATSEIYARQADASGAVTVNLPFAVPDCQNAEYRILVSDGVQLILDDITIRKTPDSITLSTFNGLGQPIHEQYFSIDGSPRTIGEGYYGLEYSYDQLGRVSTITYLGSDDTPMMLRSGYAEVQYVRNYRGYAVHESYYDTMGQPVMLPANYSIIEREYGRHGSELLSLRYLDTECVPVLCMTGFACCNYTNNEKLQVVREEYIGTDGLPVMRTDGFASVEYGYDDVGNRNYYRYYDASGAPVIWSGGYCELHRTFNEKKQIIKEEYYGTDGLPIALPLGQFATEYSYDDAGNQNTIRFLDADGQPLKTTNGYSELHRTYNEKKQIVREDYYDTDSSKMIMAAGYSAVVCKYDDIGNQISLLYLDENSEPYMIGNSFAEIRRIYNDKRQIVQEDYYNTDGQPVMRTDGFASYKLEYDDIGNNTIQRFYDLDHKLTLRSAGYAEWHREYDTARHVIREEFYDTEGHLVQLPQGYAVIIREYDSDGTLVSERYYDTNNVQVDPIS